VIWQTSTLDWTTGWRCEDADGGDDCTGATGAREGQERSGDCPVAEVVAGDGEQVPALGRDRYERQVQPYPQLAAFQKDLERLVEENDRQPARDRLDYLGLFKRLQTAGYQGGYDAGRLRCGAAIHQALETAPAGSNASPGVRAADVRGQARPTSSTGRRTGLFWTG
jgi:hypothetical protein